MAIRRGQKAGRHSAVSVAVLLFVAGSPAAAQSARTFLNVAATIVESCAASVRVAGSVSVSCTDKASWTAATPSPRATSMVDGADRAKADVGYLTVTY